MTLYMFLYGKKSPGLLPYLIYPFLCCLGPANFVYEKIIKPTNKEERVISEKENGYDVEKGSNQAA